MVTNRRRISTGFLALSFCLLVTISIPVLASVFQLPSVSPLPAIPEARIVYLANNPEASSNDFTSPIRLNQRLGAEIAHNWDEVIHADQTDRIDALIIDSSVLSTVDQAWVANAYRRGTVIAGFNINGSQMSTLVNNSCVASDNFANYTDGTFFIVVSGSVSGSPEDVSRILEAYNRSCGEVAAEGVRGTAAYGFRRTSELLNSENTFNIFTQILASHLDD